MRVNRLIGGRQARLHNIYSYLLSQDDRPDAWSKISAQTMRWTGHIARAAGRKCERQVLEAEVEKADHGNSGKITKPDLEGTGKVVTRWKEIAQDRRRWKALVKVVIGP